MQTSLMFRLFSVLLVVGGFSLVEGCYTTKVRVESTPPNAQVHFDYQPKGVTPVEFETTWLGKHKLTLDHPEYEQHSEIVDLKAPAYLIFPLDFFVALLPFNVEKTYDFHVDMTEESEPVVEGNSHESEGTQEPIQ
jgi:hypothetical protein